VDGPRHYQKAEEILADLENRSYSGNTEIILSLQALAHAALARTAATALSEAPAEKRAWTNVAGITLNSGT
jgi:hypothetical protein